MENLLETLVNQNAYVRNRTDDNLKRKFLLKMKSQNSHVELKNLGKDKKGIDCIHNDFQLNNFHLITAKG